MIPVSNRSNFFRAFTIIEVLIALCIVSLIFGAVIPSMSDIVAERSLYKAMTDLEEVARAGRKSALENQTPYVIRFESGGVTLSAVTNREPLYTRQWPGGVQAMIPGTKAKLPEEWVFHENGLSAPIRIRWTRGQAWLETGFHPVTATAEDPEYRIQ